jgi:hypothetical protein
MAKKKVKAKEGRPSKYKPEFRIQVEKLCKLGATDKELADFFEVTESTLNLWKKDHPEFSESIKMGKVEADANVAHSLYHRATGYSHPDTDIRVCDGMIVQTPLIKHYPPDPTAAIFWLKNRQSKKWRDKQELEVQTTEKQVMIIGGQKLEF